MRSSAQPYADNGVLISKVLLDVGDEIEVSYSGLLAQSGADQIFAHFGYGESWQEKTFVSMERDDGVFKAAIKVQLPGILNVSFKDSANNWDNNSSDNYSFKVSEKKSSAKTSEAKTPAEKASAAKTATKATAKTAVAAVKEKSSSEKSAAKAASKTAEVKKTAAKEKTAAKKK